MNQHFPNRKCMVAKSCMSEKSIQSTGWIRAMEHKFTDMGPEITPPLTFRKRTVFKFQCPIKGEYAQLSAKAVKIVFISESVLT